MKNEKSLVIATSGLIASGKSSLLVNLARVFTEAKYNCLTIRSDQIRREDYTEEMFRKDQAGNSGADYNLEIWHRYFKQIQENIGRYNVILLDAGHSYPVSRHAIENLCTENKIDFIGLRLVASPETCMTRLLGRSKSDYSVATPEHLKRQAAYDYGEYSNYWHEIDAEQNEAGILEQAQSIIGTHQ